MRSHIETAPNHWTVFLASGSPEIIFTDELDARVWAAINDHLEDLGNRKTETAAALDDVLATLALIGQRPKVKAKT